MAVAFLLSVSIDNVNDRDEHWHSSVKKSDSLLNLFPSCILQIFLSIHVIFVH